MPYLFCLGWLTSALPSCAQDVPKPVSVEENPDIFELSAFGGVSLFSRTNQTGFNETLVNGGTTGGRASYNFSRHFSFEVNYNFSVNNAKLAVPGNFSGFNGTFGNQIQSLSFDQVFITSRVAVRASGLCGCAGLSEAKLVCADETGARAVTTT